MPPPRSPGRRLAFYLPKSPASPPLRPLGWPSMAEWWRLECMGGRNRRVRDAGAGGGMGPSGGVRWRLSTMMALVYAVQGAWWPLLTVHLNELGVSGRGRGWIFATMAIASIATPLGAGQVAD